jgi:hypothetical protein
MAVIAAYYGLPTLSVRAATFHQMLRNQHGYKVRRGGGAAGERWGGQGDAYAGLGWASARPWLPSADAQK